MGLSWASEERRERPKSGRLRVRRAREPVEIEPCGASWPRSPMRSPDVAGVEHDSFELLFFRRLGAASRRPPRSLVLESRALVRASNSRVRSPSASAARSSSVTNRWHLPQSRGTAPFANRPSRCGGASPRPFAGRSRPAYVAGYPVVRGPRGVAGASRRSTTAPKPRRRSGVAARSGSLQRWMRAEAPRAKARTCSRLAMVVSPGNVVRSAPWAHPSFTASAGASPARSP